MIAAQEETWIEGSLARLETLESQRQQLTATGQTAALAEVDEEIRALYEVLESAAGEDQQPANTGMAAAPMGMAVAPMGMAPPMQPMQPMQAPMGMAPMQPMQAPMGMGMGAPSMPMDPMAVSSGFALDDQPSRSPLPFIIGGVVVLVLGIGGFVAMSGNDKEAKAAPTEAAKEIKAGAISEDTQEPVVAKGANADRTSGTKYKEPAAVDRDVRRPSSSGVSRPRPTKKEEDDGRKITVAKSRDPLAGID
jgi:hypothetical protein